MGEGGMSTFIMLGLMMVVFYFFMIRPQMKKAKDEKKFRSELTKGQKVVTVGGIHGKIADLKENTVTIEVDNSGTKLKVERTAISLHNTTELGQAQS